MRELVLTNDPGILNVVQALLSEAGIHHMTADQNISVVDGSIGAFPRRVMVVDSEYDDAVALLREADLGAYLRQP